MKIYVSVQFLIAWMVLMPILVYIAVAFIMDMVRKFIERRNNDR